MLYTDKIVIAIIIIFTTMCPKPKPGIGKNGPCPQGTQPRRTDGQAVLEPPFQTAVIPTAARPFPLLITPLPRAWLSHVMPSCEGSTYTRYYGKTRPEKDSVGLFEELTS